MSEALIHTLQKRARLKQYHGWAPCQLNSSCAGYEHTSQSVTHHVEFNGMPFNLAQAFPNEGHRHGRHQVLQSWHIQRSLATDR